MRTTIAPEVAAWDLGNGESQVLSLALKFSHCAVAQSPLHDCIQQLTTTKTYCICTG